ncbi:MAG TPA: FKBP-type peptidyl-prolyl cis-trans isomerase [Streptosporangiaceae bacterium]|nr:FKBP-type peptidyl-prolyl cis-trans isomerase [Streptosporangiaceae bacterium]
MRRVAVALLAPLAVIVAVAGCGSSSSATPTDNNSAVKISGVAGKAPTISIPSSAPGKKLVTKVLNKGTGRVLAPTDSYLANFTVELWRGKTHKVLFSSFTSTPTSPATPQVLPVTIGLSGLQKAMSGVHVGSRVLAVLPPKYGYGPRGNSQVGVKPTDTLVWVIDVLQAFASNQAAAGKHLTDGGGALPKVTFQAGTGPEIAIPKASPPAKLVKTTLIQGTGTPVKAGQGIVVRYVASIWRTGKTFNDNWPTTTSPTAPPNLFTLGQLIPAWNTGLVGVPVGSRVMLVVPPNEGYGKTGQSSVGITGTDTLVFVIDILSVT